MCSLNFVLHNRYNKVTKCDAVKKFFQKIIEVFIVPHDSQQAIAHWGEVLHNRERMKERKISQYKAHTIKKPLY